MKPFSLSALAVFAMMFFQSLQIDAQVKGGKDTKLFDLYAFEKFEDCAYKAESMTQNDKYKNDPEPLLYLTMCYYQIARMDSSELDQQYKDPIKDALKYAYKFRKKDKTGELYEQNKLFFEDLKQAGIVAARDVYNTGKINKAAPIYSAINKFDFDDDNVRFMGGICEVMSANSQGAANIKNAVIGINKKYKKPGYKGDKVSEPLLVDAFVIYSDYLIKQNMVDSAKATVTMAKDLLPENELVKKQFNKIYGFKNEEKKPEKKSEDEMKVIYEKHVTTISNDSLKVMQQRKDEEKKQAALKAVEEEEEEEEEEE